MGDFDWGVEHAEYAFPSRTMCCFVIDTSAAMQGNPIAEVNTALAEFCDDIVSEQGLTGGLWDSLWHKQGLELALVSFDSTVTLHVSPTPAADVRLPLLVASGGARLVDGIRKAITLVRERRQWYREQGLSYYRPWIILIAKGEIDPDQDLSSLATDIHRGIERNDFHFCTINVLGSRMLAPIQVRQSPLHRLSRQGLRLTQLIHWIRFGVL